VGSRSKLLKIAEVLVIVSGIGDNRYIASAVAGSRIDLSEREVEDGMSERDWPNGREK